MTSLIAADLRAQAEAHMDSAVRTGTDLLARGYTPRDVVHGLTAVADIVADLWEQADEAQERHGAFIAKWRGRRAS
jgi:hypothetical protein